jgi:hypothetical protein
MNATLQNKNKFNILIIDDNLNFLTHISKYVLFSICSFDKSINEIVNEINLKKKEIKQIIVNINLKQVHEHKRLDFSGLKLIQQLGFIFPNVKFVALSFLNYNSVLNSSCFAKTILDCKEVTFKNYIEFIKECFINNAGEINGKNK